MVKLGDKVQPGKSWLEPSFPVMSSLSTAAASWDSPGDIQTALVCECDVTNHKGQLLAESSSFFGFSRIEYFAHHGGFWMSASTITGQLILREPPIPVEVTAYIDGVVKEVYRMKASKSKLRALFQGIFGIGGERHGLITIAVNGPGDLLDVADLKGDLKGKIVVAGDG